MAATDHLGLQFRHDHSDGLHRLQAFDPGGSDPVGTMTWHTDPVEDEEFLKYDTGEIDRLKVRPDRRRQGIATALWDEGQKYDPAPRHSPYRTQEGEAFARHVGGPLPEADEDTGKRIYRGT